MKRILILAVLLSACEYPDIEIGQYDAQIGRGFIWNQEKNGKIIEQDTVLIGPTCLIGCFGVDSTTSYYNINHNLSRDTIYIDSTWTFGYVEPK